MTPKKKPGRMVRAAIYAGAAGPKHIAKDSTINQALIDAWLAGYRAAQRDEKEFRSRHYISGYMRAMEVFGPKKENS